MQYELIIIGGGPAGVSAGVYAARKKLNTLFLTTDFQSQSTVSEDIQNWIGTVSISGSKFAKDMEAHLRHYAGDSVTIKTGVKAEQVEKIDNGFSVKLTSGEVFTAKTILIATGSTRRKLEVKGADTFEHKGLTYCATCDGPLYGGADVAVIGGGNAAFETAAQLSAYCKSVTILNRSKDFRADPVTVEKVLAKENITSLAPVEFVEVTGEKFVHGITYKNEAGETNTLPVTGIFVEIGLIPSTSFLKGVVEMTPNGQVIVDPRTQQTKTPGIWAAGDCTDGLYHQNNISSGDGVKALEDIYVNLHTK
jgi:alkyl hydroperoxide reductase subunit F